MTESPAAFAAVSYYEDDDIYPVSRITAGAIGEPGRRVIVLQAHFGSEPFSWVIEKAHALALSRTIPELLQGVRNEFPELGEPLVAAEPNLALTEPLSPLFRVGSLGVGYDRLHDLVVLSLVDARKLMPDADEDDDDGEQPEHQIYATRGQAMLLGQQAARTVAAGRPLCPHCEEPIDDFGHFCQPAAARDRRHGEYLH